MYAKKMTKQDSKEALSSIRFLVDNRDSIINFITRADSSRLRSYTEKEDTASPKVAQENVMITAATEAHERRGVATIDIPGAYLHTDTYDHVTILLRDNSQR